MASGERAQPGSRRRSRPASVVVPFPQAHAGRFAHSRLLPSGRAIVVAFALVVAAAAAYLIARETSVFAVRTVAVRGAPPALARQVQATLRGDLGTSLLRVDLGAAQTAVTALPTVAAVSFDRAFPHTLRVTIVPERPVAVVRVGADSWLVSARGRVMATLRHGAWPWLPRIWVGRGETFVVGALVNADLGPALQAVSPLGAVRFPARVTSVRTTGGELTLMLRDGIEIRLGDARDVPLKLVVAANVLPLVTSDTRYIDVSVPGRPVSGSQIAAPTTGPTTGPATGPAAESTTASAVTPSGAASDSSPATADSAPASSGSGTSAPTVTSSVTGGAPATTGSRTTPQTLNSQVEGKVKTSTGP